MKKKILILGVVFAAFLMLMLPCVNAANSQSIKNIIKEKNTEVIKPLTAGTPLWWLFYVFIFFVVTYTVGYAINILKELVN